MSEKTVAERIVEELLKEKVDGAVQSPPKKAVKPTPLVKIAAPIEKRYYDVKVDCLLPAVLTYRVLAEDPAQASSMIKNMSPVGVKHRLVGKKDLKLSVYLAGSSMLMWARNLLGV